jgi:hypothetical protein
MRHQVGRPGRAKADACLGVTAALAGPESAAVARADRQLAGPELAGPELAGVALAGPESAGPESAVAEPAGVALAGAEPAGAALADRVIPSGRAVGSGAASAACS